MTLFRNLGDLSNLADILNHTALMKWMEGDPDEVVNYFLSLVAIEGPARLGSP